MPTPIRHTRPVPRSADTAFDGNGRQWFHIRRDCDPYASLWYCPVNGGGATWGFLDSGPYGPIVALNSKDFPEFPKAVAA
jgi:hypothetical protein